VVGYAGCGEYGAVEVVGAVAEGLDGVGGGEGCGGVVGFSGGVLCAEGCGVD